MRFSLRYITSFGRIKGLKAFLISPKTDVKCSSKGLIYLGEHVKTEAGTLIKSSGGKIFFEGNNYINRNVTIVSHDMIKIGKNTTIGPNVVMFDHDHDFRNSADNNFISKPIIIGNNVWISSNCIILKGVKIGDNSVVGAGAIVTKDIPAGYIVTMKNQLLSREISL